MNFGRRGAGLAAFVLAVTQGACAAFSSPVEPTYRSVRQLVETRDVRSISTLLATLPESYVSRHALIFESRSPQEGSFHDPRAVVYGQHARFVIAFNGSSRQPGFSSLDTMEFDRESASFVFREIVFPEGSAGSVRFSEDNPASCTACHGTPPRPIWDAYPLWPGAYGERPGAAEAERARLADFRATERSNARYVRLADPPARAAERKALAYDGAGRLTPNAELGALLHHWNAEAIARDVSESRRIAPYRYALLASLAGACGAMETVPRAIEASFSATYEQFTVEARRARGRQEELKEARALSPPVSEPPPRSNVFALNRFRYIAELGMGLRMEPWSLGFERSAFDPPPPGFAALFVERAFRDDPQADKLFELARDGDCRELQRRSVAGFRAGTSESTEGSIAATRSAESPDSTRSSSGDRAVTTLLGTCAGCHEHGVGPSIAIRDRAALASASDQRRYPHGSLLAEILFRLRPEAGARRMPLGVDLSTAEVSSLEAYFGSEPRADGSAPHP